MKIEDKRYFAEAAPSVGNFESMIAKYEALGKKMVLTSDNKKEGDEVGRQYAKDLKGLNRILQAVKSSDRKTAQQVADNMDSAATDYIPKSLYNWIYKGFSSRAGSKAKFERKNTVVIKGKSKIKTGFIYQDADWQKLPVENGSWFAEIKVKRNERVVGVLTLGEFPTKEAARKAAEEELNFDSAGRYERAGSKSKFGEPTEYGSFTTKGGQTFNLGFVENNDKTITLYMESGSGNVVKSKICTSWEECQFWMKEIARKYGAVKQKVYSRHGSKAKFASIWTDGSVREANYYKIVMKQLLAAIDAKTNSLKANKQTVSQAYAMVESAISQKNASMLDEAFNNYDRANYAARNSFSHKGTKSKFSTRGAFAEASSSPMLGELLQKKVMPEGGWRAVETGSGAITIAFEDPDIAENFAKRCAENGYSATRPAITAARYFNVCVSEEGKKNETK